MLCLNPVPFSSASTQSTLSQRGVSVEAQGGPAVVVCAMFSMEPLLILVYQRKHASYQCQFRFLFLSPMPFTGMTTVDIKKLLAGMEHHYSLTKKTKNKKNAERRCM